MDFTKDDFNRMSDSGNEQHSVSENRPECRDWKRNVCQKGDQCKYYHPPKSVTDIFQRNTICHDYQNAKGCHRENCRYLHLTKEEEEYIKVNGSAPPTLSSNEMVKIEGLPPLCNDFMQGKCTRGSRCKYRHVGEPRQSRGTERFDPYSRPSDDLYRDRLEMRRRYREDMMEDEIMYLRAQVSRLKRQVADLTATNETLMDENARLRINRQQRPVSPVAVAKLGAAYSAVGSTFSAPLSNSSRLVASDPYTVAPTRSALNDPYSGGTTPALSLSGALPPRYLSN